MLSVEVEAWLGLLLPSWATPAAMVGDDGAGAGHAGHRHVVGGAGAGDGAGRGCRGPCRGQGDVTGGETGDRLAEGHGEVDGAGVGGIGLAGGLVDGDRGVRRVGGRPDGHGQRSPTELRCSAVQLMVTVLPVACSVLRRAMVLKLLLELA